MKLKLLPPIEDSQPKDPFKGLPKHIWFAMGCSPVRWWDVSKSYDRTVTQLGTYYGHLAEIAFHLANKGGYGLKFTRSKLGAPAERPVYQATGKRVWVSLEIDSGTWDLSWDDRAAWFRKWLDTPDVSVYSSSNDGNTRYHASSLLVLNP